MTRFELRPYQKNVVDSIGDENSIIKMPTGSGKTFVAAEFLKRGLEKMKKRKSMATVEATSDRRVVSLKEAAPGSHGMSALFLVPTCDLVTQQRLALQVWIGDCKVVEHMGGKPPPSGEFDILVSTPQAFLALQQENSDNSLLSWSNIFACVFDEVHHVLKNHPYRIIAHGIKAWESFNKGKKVHIIGLSASLTYAIGHKAVKNALAQLCYDLSVTKMISPTEDELSSAGYVAQDDRVETIHRPWDVPDGVIPEKARKPHMIHQIFMERIRARASTPFAARVYEVVRDIEDEIKDSYDGFTSPLHSIKLVSWEDYAFRLKSKSEENSALKHLFGFLEAWYVALRMVVQTWEEEEQLVVQWLIINDGFHCQGWFGPKLESSLNAVLRYHNEGRIRSEKLSSLRNHLLEKKKCKGVSFRAIVFVKQRISAFVLSQYLNNDEECKSYGLRTGHVTARNSRITPSVKVSHGEATSCIDNFRQGEVNVIIATSVIEEGFDVPEANVVISYDYLKDTVELCQRFGRARQKSSSLTIMAERHDRPLSTLKDVKKHQENIINEFDPTRNKMAMEKKKQSQADREQSSVHILHQSDRCERSPLEVLNVFAAKTKAVLTTEWLDLGRNKVFRCKLVYSSFSRNVERTGEGQTKKKAQQDSAKGILEELRKIIKKKR